MSMFTVMFTHKIVLYIHDLSATLGQQMLLC